MNCELFFADLAKAWRIECEGACYQFLSRGKDRQDFCSATTIHRSSGLHDGLLRAV